MLDRLTIADFTDLVGTRFTLAPPAAEPVETDLVSVTPQPRATSRAGGPGFVLVFRAKTAARLDQKIFSLTNDRLGRFDLFLVPIGRDADGLLFEGVFN